MAEVNGLTSVQSNSPNANRKQGRQGRKRQVNRQVSLRPSASKAQRFVRPQEKQVGVQAAQLADSLQKLSPTLGKLGTYMAEKQRKEAAQSAQSEHQRMTIDQAREMVKSGEMEEHENPYFQEAFQKQYGVRLGLHEGRKLATEFHNTYNPREGGVEQFIAENMQTDIDEISQNPLVEEGFTGAMSDTLTSLRDEASKRTAETFQQDKRDGAYEVYDELFARGLAEAETPEERQQAIDNAYQTIRQTHYPENREALNLSNNEQDAIMTQVAAKYAREGDVDVVEKILTDDRGGVGAIIDKRGKAGADAAGVLNEAIKNREADNRERTFEAQMTFFNQSERGQMDEDELLKFHQETPGALSTAKVQSLIRKNRYAQEQKRADLAETQANLGIQRAQQEERTNMLTYGLEAFQAGQAHNMQNMEVTDDQGNIEVKDAEDIREATEDYILNDWSYDQVADLPEEERGEARFNLLMDIYSQNNNLVNNDWKETLTNPAASLGSAAAAAGKDGESIAPKLKEGYTLYKRIKSRNAGMLNNLGIAEGDKDVYESIRIAERYMGMDFKQAVAQAHKIQQNEDIEENPSIRAQFNEVDNAIASMNGYFDGVGEIKNDSYVGTELRKIGRFIARSGGPTGLDEAKKRFKEEHEFINGYAVPVRGRNVPNDFKDLSEIKIQEYVENNPDEEISPEDITVFPISGGGSTGVWALVDKSTATPLDNRLDSQFTISELQRDSEKRRKQAIDDAIQGVADERMSEHMIKNRHGTGFISHEKPELGVTQADVDEYHRQQKSREMISRRHGTGFIQDEKESADISDKPEEKSKPVGPPKIPDDMDKKTREAIEMFREEGITQIDFDHFLQRARGKGGDDWDMQMTFGVNPTVREKIRKYLPQV